jgi:drug/metabolite transporter (DMT)-like permease
LLGIGALAMVSQLMMTYAFKPLTAVAGSLLMLITPCLNVVLGAVLFGERVSAVSVLGALLVLGSCASVTASSAEANAVPASD